MKFSIIGYYLASIISAILEMIAMIKFLSIFHTYAMLYYERNRCARCVFFLVESLAFIFYELSSFTRNALFPVKHTQLIFDKDKIIFERYTDIYNKISDTASACDSFDKFILGMAVLKCFDHFGSQPDNDS